MTYDAENRLTGVSGGASASFVYDGDGRRVKATFGSSTTVYVGDYYEQTGSTIRKYYYASGQRVALRQGDVVYYLHTDHLGSVSVLSDGSGHEVPGSAVRYLPYGGLRLGDASTLPTDYGFTGQRLDAGTGLYQMGARWYDPRIGRWISADTVVPEPGNPQALNRYAYVYNNPLTYIDDDGHLPIIPILIAGGFIALKVVDWGWTAWDSYQSLRVMNDPNASEAAKAEAAANLAMTAAFEAVEPDDLLPVALPLDDLARKGVLKLGREAGQEAAERVGKEVAQEAVERAIKSEIRPARELLRESVPGTEVHHLFEQRFAERFGFDPKDMPAVRLDKTFHQQEVSARLFHELPTYPPQQFSPQQIWDAYKRVYGAEPGGLNRLDWLDAIWPYFEKLGVQR